MNTKYKTKKPKSNLTVIHLLHLSPEASEVLLAKQIASSQSKSKIIDELILKYIKITGEY